MGAFVMLVSAGFACWTQVNSNHRVVRASQPIFLHIICIGTFLMGASIVPLTVDEQVASKHGCDIACQIYPWLLLNGFVIAFSALFTKTHRINKIMKQPNFKRIKVTPFDVMRPMLFFVSGKSHFSNRRNPRQVFRDILTNYYLSFFAANILVLSFWAVRSPITWEREGEVEAEDEFGSHVVAEDEFGRPSETFGSCSYEGGIPFIIVLVSIDLGALLFTVYESYHARDISTEFSESDYILKALVSILLVGFIGVPVAVMARENRIAFVFACTGMIFVVCMSLLTLLFVPKVMFHMERQTQKRQTVHISSSSVHISSSSEIVLPNLPSAETESPKPREFGMEVGSKRQLKVQMKSENETLKESVMSLRHINCELGVRIERLERSESSRNLFSNQNASVTDISEDEEDESEEKPDSIRPRLLK
jgi:hypothetical protein